MEAPALVRSQAEEAEYAGKVAAREAQRQAGKKPRGKEPKAPVGGPLPKDQDNFTDPESRIMKAGSGEHFEQAYNAPAAVEVDSRLIVGERVTDAPNDKEQLEPTLAAVVPEAGAVVAALADNGFVSEAAITRVEATGPTQVLAAIKREPHGRTVSDLEKKSVPEAPGAGATFAERMAHRVATPEGRARYKLRQQTVEPVFGISKQALGFRRFSLRGVAKVNLEWTLVTLAYDLRRLHRLEADLAKA